MDNARPSSQSKTVPELGRQPIRTFEAAIDRCRELGMRLSRQRRSILELLWQTEEHLSARSIYDRLNQQGQDIGHTSVYQNLEALSSHGIIECVERCDGRLYGHVSDAHSHVNCTTTGQIYDVNVELPAELIRQVEAQTGVKISEYRVDFYGSTVQAIAPDGSTR
ncbi:Fe2+/Zn2+ uptake regulation protein [Rubidibacter lacunae KORDI 51-2]|uniref:Fe2+/Zn2+ uptake regulation protein n=1 Tax=Rubidibacter lacunae KORDI 51-2 TaxID=582515 RepID=U5DII2_9CHRO|nr:Fur family transcriptional regulator [Rubidibacter lacunae]ERN40747.1 Fe2+/Zn2+ uptake regulation protein [Rubidibacter lacunae KORDI 51-2]